MVSASIERGFLSGPRQRIAPLVRAVLGRPPGRDFVPTATEVMLISYPRSGNTWLRFVLGNLIAVDATDFVNIEDRVPSIYASSTRHIRRVPAPCVIKSHERYTPTYRRAVYLGRDPRDVAASYLRFLQRVGAQARSVTLSEFARSFLSGDG